MIFRRNDLILPSFGSSKRNLDTARDVFRFLFLFIIDRFDDGRSVSFDRSGDRWSYATWGSRLDESEIGRIHPGCSHVGRVIVSCILGTSGGIDICRRLRTELSWLDSDELRDMRGNVIVIVRNCFRFVLICGLG